MTLREITHTHIADRAWFHRTVRLAIIATAIILVWGHYDHDHEDLFELADQAILVFFAAELGLRLKAGGKQCLRSKVFWIDATIMLLCLLPLGSNILALRVLRISRLIHFAKHVPHLRHLMVLRWVSTLARRIATPA